MNHFEKVDEWLMGKVFEPVAWLCEYRWGVGYPTITRICYTAPLAIFSIANLMGGSYEVGVALTILTVIFDLSASREIESSLLRKKGTHKINSNRYKFWGRTMITLLAASFLAVFFLLVSDLVFRYVIFVALFVQTLSVYFGGCNPMPPSYRKEQEAKDAEKYLAGQQI